MPPHGQIIMPDQLQAMSKHKLGFYGDHYNLWNIKGPKYKPIVMVVEGCTSSKM
jgi:hypothetical protein